MSSNYNQLKLICFRGPQEEKIFNMKKFILVMADFPSTSFYGEIFLVKFIFDSKEKDEVSFLVICKDENEVIAIRSKFEEFCSDENPRLILQIDEDKKFISFVETQKEIRALCI